MAKLRYAFIAFLLALPLYLCSADPQQRSHESHLGIPGTRPHEAIYLGPHDHYHMLGSHGPSRGSRSGTLGHPQLTTYPGHRSHESALRRPSSKLLKRLAPVSPSHSNIPGPHTKPRRKRSSGHSHNSNRRLPPPPNSRHRSGPSISVELGARRPPAGLRASREILLGPPGHDSRGRHGPPGDFLPPSGHRGPGYPHSTLEFHPHGHHGSLHHHSGPDPHGPPPHFPGPHGPPPRHPGHSPHDPFGPHHGPHMPPPPRRHSRDRSPSVSLGFGSRRHGGGITLHL
ncbi:hypothetical protein TTRE_0000786101 [Trichuris trichiura]|uniref:Uncharacterized protein n=1 Tax=Trichuris trichiura TaxID=36087 RepID=A0A077ZLI9_TRITR|nr:hypothetical protein TTRE_0000786101 [Trichuris trichiura]